MEVAKLICYKSLRLIPASSLVALNLTDGGG